jgi:hypothetical protein
MVSVKLFVTPTDSLLCTLRHLTRAWFVPNGLKLQLQLSSGAFTTFYSSVVAISLD